MIAWPETYQKTEAAINSDEPVVARGKLDIDEERAQILLDDLRPLSVVMVDSVREVHIRAPKTRAGRRIVGKSQGIVWPACAADARSICIWSWIQAREAIFLLGNDFRVAPTEGFVGEFEQMFAPGAVELRAQQGAAI